MHYARQDLLWIKYHLKVEINNIFCTKLASKIARTASQYHGYKDLVKEICGKDISKKEQQSDWGNPNLTDKQINYAAQDTQYLFEIKNKAKSAISSHLPHLLIGVWEIVHSYNSLLFFLKLSA